MDIIASLGPINKISLLVLLIVILFLGYEIYLFRKEKKRKISISVPTFRPQTDAQQPLTSTPLRVESPPVYQNQPPKVASPKPRPKKNVPKKTVAIAIVSILMVSGIGAISYRLSQPAIPGQRLAPIAPRAQEISPPATPGEEAQTTPQQEVTPTLITQNQPDTIPTQTIPTAPPATATPLPPTAPPTPTPPPTSTPLPAQPAPTGIESLPQAGIPHVSFGLFGLGLAVIVLSLMF